eukprot:jgi/Botrbrau1/11302/Bobra.0038s0065.1
MQSTCSCLSCKQRPSSTAGRPTVGAAPRGVSPWLRLNMNSVQINVKSCSLRLVALLYILISDIRFAHAVQTDQGATLTAHNTVRANHQAGPLVWDSTAAFAAQNWAGQCALDRQYPSSYGQNIFVANSSAPSIDAAVAAWAGQEVLYNYASPQFTEATEDFTQLVWKSTTGVGCAYNNVCNSATPWISVLWCYYSPAGNVLNAFPANVLPPGSCSSRPNEVVGPDGVTCVCTSTTRRNADGYCCVPFAVYTNGACVCPSGLTFNGIGCCVANSFWSGTVQDGNCVCNPGFFWDGQSCVPNDVTCPPFSFFDGTQCVCPSNTYWTGQACCPFDSVWVPSINNCQCLSGFYWTGQACCPFDSIYTGFGCQCIDRFYWTGQACCPVDAFFNGVGCQCRNFFYWTGQACCPVDSVWTGTGCLCNSGFFWTGEACCPLNAAWTGNGCVCNSGFFWNGSVCQASSG